MSAGTSHSRTGRLRLLPWRPPNTTLLSPPCKSTQNPRSNTEPAGRQTCAWTTSICKSTQNPRSNTEPHRIAADLYGFFRLVNGSALDCRQRSVNGTQQQHLGDDPVSFRGLIKQCIRSLLQSAWPFGRSACSRWPYSLTTSICLSIT
jgi:hypothetical protein